MKDKSAKSKNSKPASSGFAASGSIHHDRDKHNDRENQCAAVMNQQGNRKPGQQGVSTGNPTPPASATTTTATTGHHHNTGKPSGFLGLLGSFFSLGYKMLEPVARFLKDTKDYVADKLHIGHHKSHGKEAADHKPADRTHSGTAVRKEANSNEHTVNKAREHCCQRYDQAADAGRRMDQGKGQDQGQTQGQATCWESDR